MKVLRKVVGKTKTYRIRIQLIGEPCGSQLINEWVERTSREWHIYLTRMDDEILVKTSRDNIPAGRRFPVRPKIRWSYLIPGKNKGKPL